MAYAPKEGGGEQETMYRFLTPGEAENQEEAATETARQGIFTRKLQRLSVMYMSFVTPEQPHGDPPICRFLASCLVITGFGLSTALVALFFYMGFAFGIDEGIMLGVFALGSWIYALVTYLRKTGCFKPMEQSSNPSPSLNVFSPVGQDPPSYKEVTRNPPSYQDALKMIKASTVGQDTNNCVVIKETKFESEPTPSCVVVVVGGGGGDQPSSKSEQNP